MSQFLPLVHAFEKVTGQRPHVITMLRWCSTGLVVCDHRVRLESKKIGGKRMTTLTMVQAFIEATNSNEKRIEPVAKRSSSRRERDHKRASEKLDQMLA